MPKISTIFLKFKWILAYFFTSEWFLILDRNVLESEILHTCTCISFKESFSQLFEFICNSFIDALSLGDFFFSSFYPLKIFSMVFDLIIFLPENSWVFFNFIDSFSTKNKIREHFNIGSSIKLAHINKFKEISFIPICKTFIK